MIARIATAIHDLVIEERANVLDGNKPSIPGLRVESGSHEAFDVMDKRPVIIHSVGEGGATYHNPDQRTLRVWDYENFVNSIDDRLQHGQRRPDFIAVAEDNTKIVINELSTGNPKSKKSDALMQMNQVIQNLKKTQLWPTIEAIPNKECVYSSRQPFAPTPAVGKPKGIADSFGAINNLLPEVIELSFKPITKNGFRVIHSDHINF